MRGGNGKGRGVVEAAGRARACCFHIFFLSFSLLPRRARALFPKLSLPGPSKMDVAARIDLADLTAGLANAQAAAEAWADGVVSEAAAAKAAHAQAVAELEGA